MEQGSVCKVAVVIPCYNEELTIAQVIMDFNMYLPHAEIWVGDNSSIDRTADIARDLGANILREERKGKGHMINNLFSQVSADVYLMIDGDATYDIRSAQLAVEAILSGFDMVIMNRINDNGKLDAHRTGHSFGNQVLTYAFSKLFDLKLVDSLSGYRAFSRPFVRSFAGTPKGFEVETELNVHATMISATVKQIDAPYGARPDGSQSKLNTWRDGFRILRSVFKLFRDTKPFIAFGLLALPWLLVSIYMSARPIVEFLNSGLVTRFPSLIVGVGSGLLSVLLITVGALLDRSATLRNEMRRLSYLANKRF